MPSLVIPESGMSLGSFPGASSADSAVPDVFGLTLTDAVIEEMIKCVQNGQGLQLSLGECPSLSYGSKVQNLAASEESFPYDLFQSTTDTEFPSNTIDNMLPDNPKPLRANPKKGVIQVQPKVNHQWRAQMGIKFGSTKFPTPRSIAKPAAAINPTPAPKVLPATTGTDDALAQLQGALESEKLKKQENTTKVIDTLGVPRGRGVPAQKATNKSKFLNKPSLASGTTRSMPSSPALNGVGSPSLGPTSVPLSQQNAEKQKTARKPVIHLLAVEALSEKNLQKKLPEISENELSNALRKVGDLNETTSKWELRKTYWKELDVWSYKYEDSADRQRAIDNAVKQYDKMRLGVSEPEWDRLLVKAERGTGKSLSKLQAEIAAKGNLARAPKNADGSGRDTPNGEEDLFDDKNLSKVKGEGAARSASQPPTTKTKKVSEKEAQAKRLFSKNPSKPTAKAAPKAAPAKKQAPAPKAGTKVLSSEYVEDSDEDDQPAAPPAPKAKPKPKPVLKRSREADDETSDSSIPLSKKAKKDMPVATSNHRVSDASQTSRTTNASYSSASTSTKNKSNSPQKSSPLASSPPTNASDFENSSSDRTSSSASPAQHMSTKNSRSPIYKRHQKSSSVTSSSSGGVHVKPEALRLAARYKAFYPRYVELFQEVAAEGDRRTKSKEIDLLEMHQRLERMRRQIAAMIQEEM